MFRVVSIFLVLAIAVAGYFYLSSDSPLKLTDFNPLQQDEKQLTQEQPKQPVKDALEILSTTETPESPESPLNLPVLSEEEKKQAKAHVQSITAAEDKPIEIKSADHFVTAEQILQLPELQQPEIVQIETVEPVIALVIKPSEEDKAILTVVEQNAKSAATAQSFAVKIPSFKKSFKSTTEAEPIVTSTATAEKVIEKIAPPAVVDTVAVATDEPAKVIKATKQPALIEEVLSKQVTDQPGKSTDNTTQINVVPTIVAVTPTPAATVDVTPTAISEQQPKPAAVPLTSVAAIADASRQTAKSEATDSSILTTLKKNIAAISDIKVSELVNLVSSKEPEPLTEVVKAAKPQSTAVATVTTAQPVVTEVTVSTAASSKQTVSAPSPTSSVPALVTKPAKANSESEKNRIKLRELLSDTSADNKRIFYLHAVNPSDEQGIWGIIQAGLTGTFSKGITLEQADGKVRALIPQDADEILSSKKSSFLGRLLNYKVLTTYVYNYEQGNIGKNPDFIKPGQQLIIVTFTEEELMSVYNHFKNYRGE
ncbi:MAG: hypothetical protein MJK10_15980 [Pseudomonadales bacterium]|nr:hypothetical protein [Pseudomonadales bacterium]NRA17633.1 hypothetical protein [Oceanospirillaceae bacterium]